MDRVRVEALNLAYAPDRGVAGPFATWSRRDTIHLFDCEPAHFTAFMSSQARASYEDGVFRILGPATDPEIFAWNGAGGWQASWAAHANKLIVFAYDWLGRLYGLDGERMLRREPLVTRLDPGDGTLRLSDSTFAEFMFDELVHYGEQLLDSALYRHWIGSTGRALAGTEVVGYIAPLFNAGTNAFTNMSVQPLRAYHERIGRAHSVRHRVVRREPSLRERIRGGR